MNNLRKAAEQALEALENVLDNYGEPLDKLSITGGMYEALYCRDAITALRAALAEPVQEPLTEDEIALIVADCSASAHRHDDFSFARAIERAHGIKENL